MKAKILLIIGPTAVGKSSILERALGDFPELVDIITCTTRPMRTGESEGHSRGSAQLRSSLERNGGAASYSSVGE